MKRVVDKENLYSVHGTFQNHVSFFETLGSTESICLNLCVSILEIN